MASKPIITREAREADETARDPLIAALSTTAMPLRTPLCVPLGVANPCFRFSFFIMLSLHAFFARERRLTEQLLLQ
jgi:hypothetical protein